MSLYVIDSLPFAEQQAMRLDGHAYRLADSYVSISIPEVSAVRAAAVHAGRTARLVAARRTAAWIWEATPLRPAVDEYAVSSEARWRPRAGDPMELIEAVLTTEDVVTAGGVLVTSPLRTAIDICRFSARLSPADALTVRSLGDRGAFGLAECLSLLDARPRLAGKRRTRERLISCWDGELSPS
ncbi:hypothetical protein [Salinibacterium sp. ZJ77]|uniref:hypothetical protein n=1 Tax=Salinibacterium sp. ZJ77 TaxID=2708337 RepID=UPI0014215DA5|nr:hypothetical protein [Salinibacterium sp. ZJ77]